MSPSAKEGELDTRNDLWAVGITMLECALNRVPKKLATTATVPIEEMRERDYTEPFIRVVAKALNKDIEKGFQSAGEMLAKVRELTKKKTGQTTIKKNLQQMQQQMQQLRQGQQPIQLNHRQIAQKCYIRLHNYHTLTD